MTILNKQGNIIKEFGKCRDGCDTDIGWDRDEERIVELKDPSMFHTTKRCLDLRQTNAPYKHPYYFEFEGYNSKRRRG